MSLAEGLWTQAMRNGRTARLEVVDDEGNRLAGMTFELDARNPLELNVANPPPLPLDHDELLDAVIRSVPPPEGWDIELKGRVVGLQLGAP